MGLVIVNYVRLNILPDALAALMPGTLSAVRDGTVSIFVSNDIFPTIVYAFMMIVMKPVAEELFFRKAIIKFGSKKKVVAFTILSLLLCALSRAHGFVGIAEWMLMALPVTIAYLATRNIYISVMAHVLFEFYDNIYTVVYAIARIFNR
ncbi:MAG: CPBP family intramembrane metalloprotease [Butyrivibrio sp.]|nr:CPBP family intramembrane metalloprotease [Butyrivibrio sp.]